MDFFLLFMFSVCHGVLSVYCSLVVTCWERAGLSALLYVMFFFCVFVTFPCGVLGKVWYFIVSIPDICLLPYFPSNIDFPKWHREIAASLDDFSNRWFKRENVKSGA